MLCAHSFWTWSIGDYIALVAALVAFVTLLVGIINANNQFFIQNFSDYTKRYQEIIQQFPENVNEANFVLPPPSSEYSKIMRAMRQYFDLCFEEHYLFKKGKLPKDLWIIWKEGILFAFSKPAFQLAWNIIQKDTQYSKDFKDFLLTGNIKTK